LKQKELAAIRRYHDISQEKMANYLNITTRTYINKENGVSEFRLSEIFKISKLFNRSIEEIFLVDNFILGENGEVTS